MVIILYLHHHAELSGGEASLLALWERLDRREFLPTLAGPDQGPLSESARRLGVRVHPIPFPRLRGLLGPALLQTIRPLRTLIQQAGVNIIHGNAPVTNLVAALAGRLTGCRIVWHERTLPLPGEWDLDRSLCGLPHRILCNSVAVAERFPARRKVVVIRNGVDLDRFRPEPSEPALRGRMGIRPQDCLIGMVGNFSLSKRHEIFLEAAARAARLDPALRFWIVGGEVFAANRGREVTLHHLADRYELGDRIAFLGERQDIPAVMNALDLLAAPGVGEACSRAILEAMACGRPVVGAADGGTPELIVHGKTGLLVPPDDAQTLAHAMVSLARDQAGREAMGQSARRRAEAAFSLDRQVRETEAVYRSLVAA